MQIFLKSIIAIFLGFFLSFLLGLIIVPIIKKFNGRQSISRTINIRHLKKEGTPTMGGLIFILSAVLIIFFLYLNKKVTLSNNFLSILFVFISYAFVGFLDDFLKIKRKNNAGLSILTKFFLEIVIATIFFAIFLYNGNNTVLAFSFFSFDLKFLYGLFILFLLATFSNSVNITDGLDGLCAGLCAISFFIYGILAWNSSYILGYEEIAIFCFCLSGALIGFLFFNFYPAKIFMGDLGSLALGGLMASVAIILKQEVSLIFVGIIYLLEVTSSFLQIVFIRIFKRKIFRKSPFHHHLEELGYEEVDIIKLFYTFCLFFSFLALIYYVWI